MVVVVEGGRKEEKTPGVCVGAGFFSCFFFLFLPLCYGACIYFIELVLMICKPTKIMLVVFIE